MTAVGDAVPVEVPDIGDFDDVPIIEVHVAPGDAVAADDPLLTLESDKATMDVPAPFAGIVRELHVAVGDKVSQGTLLLTIEPGADRTISSEAAAIASEGVPSEADAPAAVAAALDAEGPSLPGPAAAPPVDVDGAEPVYASPSVRRRARELGIDLRGVAGTGRKGRITLEDLERGPAAPPAPARGRGGEERVPLKRIQKIAAPRLTQSWNTIPHVTHNDEADITELEAWRGRLNEEHASEGVKVTMVSFLIVACVATLKEFPDFNASLDGDELIRKLYYNIGFAADTPGGLVVPVIKAADQKGLLEIARELAELSAKAREGKLGPAEMSASTFTISSLGGIGGTSFTPIVNAPEVAILGVTRATMKPVWSSTENEFVPRLMLPLSLSYDHRVIDGAAAARFVVHLAGVLSDLRRALL